MWLCLQVLSFIHTPSLPLSPNSPLLLHPFLSLAPSPSLPPSLPCSPSLPYSLAPSLPPPPLQCILTLRESDSTASDAIASTFCFCSWNNQSFSACTIEDLQLQIAAVPSNEIRNYFKVLTEMLVSVGLDGNLTICSMFTVLPA